MKNNLEKQNGCILLKNREYEELKEEANKNKPEHITLTFKFYDKNLYFRIDTTLNLSEKLLSQITHICDNIRENIDNHVKQFIKNATPNIEDDLLMKVANMSFRKRNKFLKEYKRKSYMSAKWDNYDWG
jgi:hypothetical protein